MLREAANEVFGDATEHIRPTINMLHQWLLKIRAPMPSISRPAELSAPVAKMIDHTLMEENQDRQESKFISQPYHQGSRTQ